MATTPKSDTPVLRSDEPAAWTSAVIIIPLVSPNRAFAVTLGWSYFVQISRPKFSVSSELPRTRPPKPVSFHKNQ